MIYADFIDTQLYKNIKKFYMLHLRQNNNIKQYEKMEQDEIILTQFDDFVYTFVDSFNDSVEFVEEEVTEYVNSYNDIEEDYE